MTKKLALVVFALFTLTAHAKIVFHKDKVYIQNGGERKPLSLVNELIESKAISKIKLYGGGEVPVISFSKRGNDEKLYSVDQKGYVYSIEPFANYSVSKIHSAGMFEFKQAPGRKYKVDKNGFFLY